MDLQGLAVGLHTLTNMVMASARSDEIGDEQHNHHAQSHVPADPLTMIYYEDTCMPPKFGQRPAPKAPRTSHTRM